MGWNGAQDDEYFLLSDITPNGLNFTSSQMAYIDIEPGIPMVFANRNMSGANVGGTLADDIISTSGVEFPSTLIPI